MKPSIFLVAFVILGGLLTAGCASPADFAGRSPVKPSIYERIRPDPSHSTIEPIPPGSQAPPQNAPREGRVTPTWTAGPAATGAAPVMIFEAVVGTEPPAPAAAPGGEQPEASSNVAEFNSPLPTPPYSPLPTPPESPLPMPTEWPLRPTIVVLPMPTGVPSLTPTEGPTATPSPTGSPTVTPTPPRHVTRQPTNTPTGSTTPSPTVGIPSRTPTWIATPAPIVSLTPVRGAPTPPDSPLPTPTWPGSPLPTPTSPCCYDCDC